MEFRTLYINIGHIVYCFYITFTQLILPVCITYYNPNGSRIVRPSISENICCIIQLLLITISISVSMPLHNMCNADSLCITNSLSDGIRPAAECLDCGRSQTVMGLEASHWAFYGNGEGHGYGLAWHGERHGNAAISRLGASGWVN